MHVYGSVWVLVVALCVGLIWGPNQFPKSCGTILDHQIPLQKIGWPAVGLLTPAV